MFELDRNYCVLQIRARGEQTPFNCYMEPEERAVICHLEEIEHARGHTV